jgi:hypothetical protein
MSVMYHRQSHMELIFFIVLVLLVLHIVTWITQRYGTDVLPSPVSEEIVFTLFGIFYRCGKLRVTSYPENYGMEEVININNFDFR